jgi:hypothetical protein
VILTRVDLFVAGLTPSLEPAGRRRTAANGPTGGDRSSRLPLPRHPADVVPPPPLAAEWDPRPRRRPRRHRLAAPDAVTSPCHCRASPTPTPFGRRRPTIPHVGRLLGHARAPNRALGQAKPCARTWAVVGRNCVARHPGLESGIPPGKDHPYPLNFPQSLNLPPALIKTPYLLHLNSDLGDFCA